ncbi:MAG: NADH-quinone oxidoreductase subunit C [Candidatus Omnitrophica bacterium]|nr:NADH-quinone oxidoreductase subunit C [Candidatus Omnitrophota bacterium]
MNKDTILNSIKERFKDTIKDFSDKSPGRVYIEIDPKDIKDVVEYIFVDLRARFNIASGLDARSHFEILYHFTFDKLGFIVSIRVKLNKDKPKIDSIAAIIKGAEWIEREMHELIGIDFPGHPNLKRLLLPDEWPKGVYPLRADYKEWDKGAIRDRGV